MNFYLLIYQRLRADDFQIPPHRQSRIRLAAIMKIPLIILLFLSLNTSFGQMQCSLRLITTSKGVSDSQSDTLLIQDIRLYVKTPFWIKSDDSILVTMLSGEKIHLSYKNVWGIENCGTFERIGPWKFYVVRQIGSLIIYSFVQRYMHHSETIYYFSKTLDDKIYRLNWKNIKKQFKDNPCYLEKINKELNGYKELWNLNNTTGQDKIVSIYDKCKN